MTIINYKNSSIYVQKQIDRFFRIYQKFVKIYIDDIIIFSRILEKHVTYLRQIFDKFVQFNIFIKFIKTFIDYLFVQLLDQKIDFYTLFTNEKKLKTIFKFQFSRIFRQLKTYLNLIDWFKKYLSYYVDVSKIFQKKKLFCWNFFHEKKRSKNFRKSNSRRYFNAQEICLILNFIIFFIEIYIFDSLQCQIINLYKFEYQQKIWHRCYNLSYQKKFSQRELLVTFRHRVYFIFISFFELNRDKILID